MSKLKSILDEACERYNSSGFIKDDPILIPHGYSKKEDIEIMGFLIALIAWGQRTSIIKSGNRLSELFGNTPHDFITGHKDSDLKPCLGFVHRTFNGDDLISLIGFLKEIYMKPGGLEHAFSDHMGKKDRDTGNALTGFKRQYESSPSYLKRCAKHIASPESGSACKRLNMFLRWMVRSDQNGVDFGLWKSIDPSQLVCPLDIHVLTQAKRLGLIREMKSDWKTAIALTNRLKRFDSSDPVRYDFALFGMGIESKMFKQNPLK